MWMVDWSAVAAGPCYPAVVASLNYVGTCVAQFVQNVLNVTMAPSQKLFHVIGFSMGAHVAAYTANNLRPYKLPRITGTVTSSTDKIIGRMILQPLNRDGFYRIRSCVTLVYEFKFG